MRIDRLDLIRFGHFAGREIELPVSKPDFYVLYGDNEAGKSTLLRAISALFFGVPIKTQDTHTFKGSELRIGATVSNGDKTFSFRRRKGTSATLLSQEEAQLQESALSAFLRELDRERFEQFFALNHDRLREGGEELLRGKGDIGSALFQAAGLLDLRKLLDGLDKEARELFSPKSRGKVIGTALDEYKQARSEMRRLAISAATVKEKQAELHAADEALKKLKTESQTLQDELVRLRRIASNKPDIARLHDLRSALAALESIPALPITARRQRDEATTVLTAATAQILTLSGQVAQRKARIEELPLSTTFKAYAKQIEDLNAEIGQYILSVKDRPKRIADRDEAVALAEVEWKEIWRKRPIGDAEELKSAYSRKTEILELITEQARLSTALEQAQEQMRVGKEEQQRLQEELALHPQPADPALLMATIAQAKSPGDIEQNVVKLKAEIHRLQTAATRDLRGLRLFTGGIQELASLTTPLLTTIDRYAREWEDLATTRKDLKTQLANAAAALQGKQAELKALGKQIGKAGENDLTAARARRDELWKLIRASAFDRKLTRDNAQKKSGSSVALPDAFAEQIDRADQIADLRFANAKDVAINDRLVKEIEQIRIQQTTVEAELARQEQEDQDLRQRWANEWRALGCQPLSPLEMKEWMQLRQAILERLEQCREKESELRLLQERAKDSAAQIRAQLKDLDCPTAGDGSLAALISLAEKFAHDVEERRRSHSDFRRRLQALSLDQRQARLEESKTKLSEWSQKWVPIVRALFLPEVATPTQVTEALVMLEKVFTHLRDADNLKYRIKRIGDNIEAFENKAAQLIAAIDPSLASLPPEQATAQLHSRYVETGKAETERDTLEAQNASDGLVIADCRSRVQTAEATLKKLREAAKCDDDQQLEATIAAAEQRTARQVEYERIASGLIERNAVPEVKQIEEEAAGYELDSLQSQIESKDNRRQELENEIFEAGSKHGKLQEEYGRLEASSESALQAQKAEDALARIRPAIGQYLRLRLASEAVQRAIESYREKHQAPVLKRASEFFSVLTQYNYSGLTTAFASDDKPVLVAVRKSGEHVEVEGLSDGTRDQLYLALRLAFIEHHVQTVAPCPVILDDILINSDDARSLAALRVIENLAQSTQVLFFTHHRRLVELGSRAGAQVVEFGAVAAAAIA